MAGQSITPGRKITYLDLINDCNRVKDEGEDVTGLNPISNEPYTEETELVRFIARNARGQYRIYGYLPLEVVAHLPWEEWDFQMVDLDGDPVDREFAGADIVVLKEVESSDSMADLLISPLSHSEFVSAFPILGMCQETPGHHLPLLGGPPDIGIPKYLTHLYGAAQHQVHIVLWSTGENGDAEIWARKRTGTGIYDGVFESAVVGEIRHGDDEEVTVERMWADGVFHNPDPDTHMSILPQVSYFTIGAEEAGHLKGLVDAAIVSCYSAFSPMDWLLKENDVGDCEKYSVEDIQSQLLSGQWTPGGALSMLRFLTSHNFMTQQDTPDYNSIVSELWRKLPHHRVEECAPDRSENLHD